MFMGHCIYSQAAINLDYTYQADTTYIQWVSQYPSTEVNTNKKGFLKRIGELLVGKKSSGIKKPISVLADNPDLFWILDQGNGIVVEVNKNSGEIPKQFKKRTELFTSLIGLCSKPNKDILFTDSRSNKI